MHGSSLTFFLAVGHVPFRDSKLTRLLQPALGGNCRTAVVCTITPAYIHAEETLNTLRFALRAQHVRQHAEVNEASHWLACCAPASPCAGIHMPR